MKQNVVTWPRADGNHYVIEEMPQTTTMTSMTSRTLTSVMTVELILLVISMTKKSILMKMNFSLGWLVLEYYLVLSLFFYQSVSFGVILIREN